MDVKHLTQGPLVALIMAMSEEWIAMLQAEVERATDERESPIVILEWQLKLDRMLMLNQMVEISLDKPEPEKFSPEERIISDITAYLQEYDPEVFPIKLWVSNKQFQLETWLGIKKEIAEHFDTAYPGLIVLHQPIGYDRA